MLASSVLVGNKSIIFPWWGKCRNALLMNALSTPSHLPSRQPSASRNSSVAEFQAEEEQRNAQLDMYHQQVQNTLRHPVSPPPRAFWPPVAVPPSTCNITWLMLQCLALSGC